MILIAFGANLPGPAGSPPQETCLRALTAIAAIPGLATVAVSPLYISAPVPISDQPSYINGVLRAEGDIDPALLLARLLEIEHVFGRRRAGLNAARSLASTSLPWGQWESWCARRRIPSCLIPGRMSAPSSSIRSAMSRRSGAIPSSTARLPRCWQLFRPRLSNGPVERCQP